MRVIHPSGLAALWLLVYACSADPTGAPNPTYGAASLTTSTGGGGSQNVTSGSAGRGDDVGSGSGGAAGSGGSVTMGEGGGSLATGGSGGAPVDASGGSANGGASVSDAGQPVPLDFACSEMVGLWVMSQWWGAFEKGVDNARWQYIFVHHGYLEMWADPASPYWKTAVISPCAMHPEGPDRVIFLPFSLSLNTLEQWQSNLTQVVSAIQTNFPSVKRIELISTIRSPGNQPCANDQDPNVVVPPYVDQAIQNVADGSGGLVTVGPRIAVANCNWWVGGTDLTGEGNTGVGQLYAEYYKTH